MSRSAVTICKFVGTIGLGLLTGQSLTLSLNIIPTLSTLPSSPQASKTHNQVASLTRRQTALLSTLSASAFLLAFTLSPRRYRHPYLLYASLAIGAGWSGEIKEYIFPSSKQSSQQQNEDLHSKGATGGASSPGVESSGDEEWDVAGASTVAGLPGVGEKGGLQGTPSSTSSQDLNGESVREGLERWRKRMGIKAGVWGLGWVMAVVGLWGDGI